MTVPDQDMTALAAGFVTATLTEAEGAEAEALLVSSTVFANMVREFRQILDAEGVHDLPERVWLGIERRLTGRQN